MSFIIKELRRIFKAFLVKYVSFDLNPCWRDFLRLIRMGLSVMDFTACQDVLALPIFISRDI